MARQRGRETSIPAPARPAYDTIVGLTDGFCRYHLNYEYSVLCRRLAGVLARKRPCPLARGKPEVWACAILRVIGRVNCLGDSSQTPHLKPTAIDRALGVSQGTGPAKAKTIRDLLKIRQFDTEWTLPSRVGQNPMAWMIQVNGLAVDARGMPREIQEEAYRKGLIPYLPDEGPDDPAYEDGGQGQEEAPGGITRSAAADVACLVGDLHLRKGEYKKAVQAFSRAIEHSPTVEAYEGRARGYRALAAKDEQQAREQSARG
jgi:hypothetical protein